MSDPTPTNACTEVYFDGSCPLCRREISLYQNLKSDQPIEWVDVSVEQSSLPAGVTQAQLMQRFHTRTAQGELLSGAAAFVHIWAQLPGWRLLASLARIPGVLWLMERAYRGFLVIRPGIQRVFRKLDQA
ncbi:MAG TPA: DUF393 domain-containing protein [Limnobacter sp.]|uniref:thiol-disulfide oxidoreductase DCC family protein n=1 Tax=Limnobacter sp. TaxID=2003368 RepID=UPI002E2FB376|nr:DUF393 domain-containing protein [Limnobacter sp.]HEX5486218.1 DUF393 domain-containing protein [Limnobacter sp.]